MACCADYGCGDPGCRLCTVVARMPQPVFRGDLQKRDRAELRESKVLPDLTGPRAAAIALGQVKRHRDGPHRGNA